jgi:uncharacterized protein with von Willebrand factor type A (vWA) domain
MPHKLLANLLVFARTLKAAGIFVRAGGVPDAVRALGEVGLSDKRVVRDALRTVLVNRHADFVRFDRLFERFWRVWPETPGSLPQPMQAPGRTPTRVRFVGPSLGAASEQQPQREPAGENPVTLRTYSSDPAWRQKNFEAFTPEDFTRAEEVLARLAWTPGARVTRRWVGGAGRTVDLRRLLAVNAKYGGELLTIPQRARRLAVRPLILICDVSGSMEPYTRMLLLFAHALAWGHRRVEVFVFSTRLTRITRQLDSTKLDAELTRVREVAGDWSGGTRIGEAIHAFNVDWGRRVSGRGPVLLLISDGWDLGEPALLAREMARLQRSVHRLVWLNPLLGSPGYQPLTRGMLAALPFVDDFLPVHNMASLEALATHLSSLSDRHARSRSVRWN